MLPLHASLALTAPFDVALRLYHLSSAIRWRNNELLDVFPEVLTVLDDRLFSNFQVEITRKEISDAANAAGCDSQMNVVPATKDTIILKEPQLLPSVQQPSLSTPMREVRILPGEGMVFICNIIQL